MGLTAQRDRQPVNRVEGNIFFRALQLADRLTRHIGHLRQPLLRQPTLFPKPAQVAGEGFERGLPGFAHGLTLEGDRKIICKICLSI